VERAVKSQYDVDRGSDDGSQSKTHGLRDREGLMDGWLAYGIV
jgi:hypothetical protein